MDLFRRIFGKTSEEESPRQPLPADDSSSTVPIAVDTQVSEDLDELDPTTRPLGADLPPHMLANGVTQPLTREKLVAQRNDHIAFGQATDVGLVRNNNQDSALSLLYTSRSVDEQPDFGLFVVADGMGGHHDGERASAITTKVIASYIANHLFVPLLSGNNDVDQTPRTEALVAAIQTANTEVIQQVPQGGTTVTSVIVVGDLAHIAHVGDSRAYLMTKDGIEQITRDHSLVQRLIELDQLTPEEAIDHPQKNVLYRALGQNESLEVDTLTRRLPADSRLLVCSDGLWGLIAESDIYEIAVNNSDPQQACDKLVALANTHGGVDNITAILLKIN